MDMTDIAGRADILAPIEQEGTKAVVRAWLKCVGDAVAEGDALLELETDKVTVEVSAPASGILTAILVESGQDAQPGAVLGRIAPQGSAGTALARPHAEVPAEGRLRGVPQDEDRGGVRAAPPTTPSPLPNGPSRSIASFDPALRLSPSVRVALMETGLDPASLTGTGKDGRLTRADVSAAHAAPAPAALAQAGRPVAAASASGEFRARRVPHSAMRRRIAEHMAHSVATAPHVTAMFEADLTAMLAHRAAHKEAFAAKGIGLTPTAYFIGATVEAMKVVPVINSRWSDDALDIYDDVNVGIGTSLPEGEGLIVPVVHGAQTLSLEGVAARLHDMTARARAGRLGPGDVRNGTFTISNHGVSGSLLASPIIIKQPQSAILGIGKLQKRVVVREVAGSDAIVIRPMAYVTLTIDHRVVDGAQTNAWLTRFVEVLESWT